MIRYNSHTKKRNYKGSVLFTVLAVMLVMIIIVLTTIALAGIASKKAYSTWFDNQTNYTAQSLVDNVVGSFQKGGGNEELGKKVIKNLKTKNSVVNLDVDGLPAEYGEVESFTLKNVGSTDEYNFEGTAKGKEQIIKVTAVVNMGGETSTYSTYVTGDLKSGSSGGGAPGGYISTGELDAETDAPNTYGRVYAGIQKKAKKSLIRNQTRFGGDIFYNSELLEANASAGQTVGDPLMQFGRNDPDNELFSGLAVTGELKLREHLIVSNYPNKDGAGVDIDLSKEKYYNMPYIYCQKLTVGSGEITHVDILGGMNIYCEEIQAGDKEGSFISGTYNLICTKVNGDNSMWLEQNPTKLIGWMDSLRDDLKADHSQAEQFLKDNTGNVYCRGNMAIKGREDSGIAGDLYVMGDLKLDGSNFKELKVGGNLYVGGTIDKNGKQLTVSGGTFEGLGKDETNFVSGCNGASSGAGSKFSEVMVTKIGTAESNGKTYDKLIYQNLDHLQSVYIGKDKDDNDIYIGAKETSNLKADATTKTLTGSNKTVRIDKTNNYFKWEGIDGALYWPISATGKKLYKTVVYIDPGEDAMWINFAENFVGLDSCLIVVNDENPKGSVNFFIDSSSKAINVNKSYIVTRTYAEQLFETNHATKFSDYEVTMDGDQPKLKSSINLNLTAFPTDEKEVPHIYWYAASDNKVAISLTNDGICTFEVVAPNATFSADADSGVPANVTYTYNIKKGATSPNDVSYTRNGVKLRVIGSLETGKLDNDNLFAYFYVDDVSGDDPMEGGDEEYSWNIADGYSSY